MTLSFNWFMVFEVEKSQEISRLATDCHLGVATLEKIGKDGSNRYLSKIQGSESLSLPCSLPSFHNHFRVAKSQSLHWSLPSSQPLFHNHFRVATRVETRIVIREANIFFLIHYPESQPKVRVVKMTRVATRVAARVVIAIYYPEMIMERWLRPG